MEYMFCKPDSENDYENLYKLMDAAFGDEDVRGITKRFAEYHPEMKNEHFFMLKKGKQVVAGLVLLPQTWEIGGVRVKVAEMGCVGTNPEFRRKRLQWILNDKFDEYARENGFDLCVLAGIPYFYRQFGYQYAVGLDYSTLIDVKKIPDYGSKLETRVTKETDIPVMDEILKKTQDKYFVMSLRPQGIWEMQQKTGTYGGEPFLGMSLLKQDKLIGYYRYVEDQKKSTLYIRELGFNDEIPVEQIGNKLKKHAVEKGLEKVKTAIAHTDQLAEYLVEIGGEINTPYAWQIKPLDLFGLMQKMKPAFENRLAESQFKGLTKTLAFNFFKFVVKMEIKEGEIKNIEKYYGEESRTLGFNPYAFIQLITGYKDWQELATSYSDFWVRDGLDDLVDVLFPKGSGYIHYTY